MQCTWCMPLHSPRQGGHPFVVVIGQPDYYHRFGFVRGSDFGLRHEFGADEAFMVVELQPGSLPAEGGLVRYEPEFGAWAV
jgi:putative acetyltransferase